MPTAIIYMALAVFLYALSNVFVKLLIPIPSMEIVFFRSIVSLVISLILLGINRITPLGNNRKFLLTRGAFGALALLLSYSAIPHLPLATTAVIGYLAPIFTAILAFIFLREKVHILQWFIFLFTFSGILLIKGFDPKVAAGPFLTGLLAIFFSACGYVTIRKAREQEHPLTIVLYTSLLAIPISGSYWFKNQEMAAYSLTDWIYLLLIGILTQLAQLLMTKAYQMADAVKIANLNYTSILYSLLFGYFFFNEVFNWLTFMGIVVVKTGVFLNIHFDSIKNYIKSVYASKMWK